MMGCSLDLVQIVPNTARFKHGERVYADDSVPEMTMISRIIKNIYNVFDNAGYKLRNDVD